MIKTLIKVIMEAVTWGVTFVELGWFHSDSGARMPGALPWQRPDLRASWSLGSRCLVQDSSQRSSAQCLVEPCTIYRINTNQITEDVT
jgi:hypothetical protein